MTTPTFKITVFAENEKIIFTGLVLEEFFCDIVKICRDIGFSFRSELCK